MKIIHVADYVMPDMGYQEFILPKWNAKHGHSVHIITSDRYTPVPDYDSTWKEILGPRRIGFSTKILNDVTIHRLPVRLEFKRRIWLSGLKVKIKEIQPDIVFCHGTSSPLAFKLAKICKQLHIPLIMDNHMAFVAQGKGLTATIYYFLLKLVTKIYINNRVQHFFGMSQESCDFMVTQQGINRTKVSTLDFGVDTDIFIPDHEKSVITRSKYGIPNEAIIVMQTGKLSKEKGTETLTEAILEPMKQNPNIWLVFVGGGNGDYLDKCLNPLTAQSMSDRVKVIPFVPITELPNLMNMSDICVYPGESSLSCMEASACNKPVIITDLPWGKTRAEAGIGTCYETGNAKNLQMHLEQLMESPALRQSLGQTARTKVIELYSYDQVAKNVESIMENIVKSYVSI
jgi:glycosyltransferase involved in cell wall biosynthesis